MSDHNTICLIDLSSIAYPIWFTSQSEPDVNHASTQIVARVRSLAEGFPHVAVCLDSGRSFRHDLTATYKANRAEHDVRLMHQIKLATDALDGDGFPLWSAPGFEADDLIATATARALATEGLNVQIVSADKDLLQLVGDRVVVRHAVKGHMVDAAGVKEKFGVEPSQMLDYLTMVGDASDNITGAKNIGPKTAANLLTSFLALDRIYDALSQSVDVKKIGLTPSVAQSLRDFYPQMKLTRQLITLRTDAPLPFEQIAIERTPKAVADFAASLSEDTDDMPTEQQTDDQLSIQAPTTGPTLVERSDPATQALQISDHPTSLMAGPVQWERALEPRTMGDARVLAKDLYQSAMFSAYGSPQAVLTTILVGRELGLPAMASLRSIHNIKGRHALSAAFMVGLVLKSGFAEYFEPLSFGPEEATFETHRKGARNPVRLTHTIDMARTAGLLKDDSNWLKVPTDMLVARAQSRLARLVYADILAGLYSIEELAELREAA